ncbi:MAG: hypothetical protein HOV79_29140 [Hamadaea sp.]|nr:hypothetical protein [Hamadaea sp.]
MTTYAASGAFGSSGTLNAQLVQVSSGSRPYDTTAGPGKDESATDTVVRSGDLATFRVDVSSHGAVDDALARMTIDGPARWQAIPDLCADGDSALARDGHELVCALGDLANQTTGVEFLLRVDADARNSAPVKAQAEVEGDGLAAVPAGTATVTVSAAPAWELSAGGAQPVIYSGVRDGLQGAFVSFPFSLLHRGSGTRGVEALPRDLTLSADTTRLYADAAPGAGAWQLVGCATNGSGDLPFPTLPGGDAMTSPDSVTCVRKPDQVEIRLTGLDSSLAKVPTTAVGGTPLPIETTYLLAGKMTFFVPGTDVEKFGRPADDGHILRMAHRLNELTSTSVSGQPNTADVAADNVAEAEVFHSDRDFDLLFGAPVTDGDAATVAPGRENALDQKGKITPGSAFTAQMTSKNLTDKPYGGPGRMCVAFDNDVQRPTGQWAAVTTDADGARVPVPGVHLEYGAGTAPAGPRSGCADADAEWRRDLSAVPGGAAAVDRIRIVADQAQPVQSVYRFLAEFAIADDAPDGAAAKSWGSASWAGRRGGESVGPAPADADATGDMADRLFVIGSIARVTVKTADPADAVTSPSDRIQAVEPGQTYRYVLQSTLTDSTGALGRTCPIKVSATFPAGIGLRDTTTANPAPTVTKRSDGTTVATWDLGSVKINDRLPVLDVPIAVATTVSGGTDLAVTATITSACDGSPESARTGVRSVAVTGQLAYRVVEDVDPPVAAVGDDVTFLLREFNEWSGPVRAADLIAHVPTSGDNVGTQITGAARLVGVTPARGGTVRYTLTPQQAVDLDPNDASNQTGGATRWCLAADLGSAGCPASVASATAVRITYAGELPSDGSRLTKITVVSPSAEDDQRLGQLFGAKVSGLALPVRSNEVLAKVVAGSIGGAVWRDVDRDGRQETAEPWVAGVTVKVAGTTERCGPVTRQTVTGPDGRYAFDDLCPGSYTVDFDPPAGSRFTTPRVGDDRDADSDADPQGLVRPRSLERMVTRPVGDVAPRMFDVASDLTIDAGLITLAAASASPDANPIPQPGSGTPSPSGTAPASGSSTATPLVTAAAGTPSASADPAVSGDPLAAAAPSTSVDDSGSGTSSTTAPADSTDGCGSPDAPGYSTASCSADGGLAETGLAGWLKPALWTGFSAVAVGSLLLGLVFLLRRRRGLHY